MEKKKHFFLGPLEIVSIFLTALEQKLTLQLSEKC
jgi:hypothetical protein